MADETDFLVLGGGSAGYAAARTAASLGLATTVVDGARELGGLCILRGCMPSKTLIESANRALVVRHGRPFGLASELQGVDTRVIRDRKRALIGEFADFRQQQLQDGRFRLIRGHGQFAGPHRALVRLLEGGTQEISFRTALIATGSVVALPAIKGLEEVGCWDSDTVLDAAEIPDSFVVLGGGAIALEMAHFLEGIGRRVTLIQRSGHVLSDMDDDLAKVVEASFRRRGIEVYTGTSLREVCRVDGKKRVFFSHHAQEQSVDADEILAALGRRPAIESLDLETAGVRLEGRLVATTRTQQTTQPHIFAAGDVSGPLEVVHLAVQQGEMAARNAAALLRQSAGLEKMDYRLKLFGVFTEPQVAAVGLGELEARQQGREVITASYPFNDHGKSMVMGELEGFVKLIADAATGELLGGAVVGPHATELIHEIMVALHFRATAAHLAGLPHYHPTLSEIWTYPAEEIAERVGAGGGAA